MTALTHQFIKQTRISVDLGRGSWYWGPQVSDSVVLGTNSAWGEHYSRMMGATSFFRMESVDQTYDANRTNWFLRDAITGRWEAMGGSTYEFPTTSTALKPNRAQALSGAGWARVKDDATNTPANHQMSLEFTYATDTGWGTFEIKKMGTLGNDFFRLYRVTGKGFATHNLQIYDEDGYGDYVALDDSNFPITDEPVHVVYTVDFSVVRTYINGVLVDTTDILDSVPSFLGLYDYPDTGSYLDIIGDDWMDLQDIAFYPKVLTAEEVSLLSQRVSTAGTDPPYKDTVANLRVTSNIAGGPIAASAAVTEDMMVAYSDYFDMGTKWNIFYDDEYPAGTPIWGGELRDGVSSAGVGAIVADGYGKRADFQIDRFMLESQNLGIWTSGMSDPIAYQDDPRIGVSINGDNMVFDVAKDSSFTQNQGGVPADGAGRWTSGMYCWVPTKDIRHISGTIHKSRKDPKYEIQIVATPTGPSGALQVLHTESMGQTGNIDFSVAISAGYDLVGIRLRRKTSIKRAPRRKFQIKNLAVSMFPKADVPDNATLTDAVNVVFDSIAGIDFRTVAASTQQVLPYDAERATYGQILDELCVFDRWYWAIYPEDDSGDGRGIARPFGTDTYYVSEAKLPVELLPDVRYNKVFFEYEYAKGVYVSDVVTGSPDVFPRDYNAVYNLAWEDPPPSPVAQLFAQAVADYLITERITGRMTLTSAYTGAGETGVLTSVGHIRPGSKLVLENYNNIEVFVDTVDLAADGSYANIQFTSGNPLLDRWLARKNRYLNSGRNAAWSTLQALDVEQPAAPDNVVMSFYKVEAHKGRAKYNLVVDWDPVIEDVEGNGTAIGSYTVMVRPGEWHATPRDVVSITSSALIEGEVDDYYEMTVVTDSTGNIAVGDLVLFDAAVPGYGWTGTYPVFSVTAVPDSTTFKFKLKEDLGDYSPGSPDVDAISVWKPKTKAQGGSWRKKTVHDSKENDLSEIIVPTQAIFKDLPHPNVWHWEARIRAEDLTGQQSDWSILTYPTWSNDYGLPAVPTNPTIEIGQHQIHMGWDAPSDFNDSDGDPAPSEDIAHYKIRLFKNGSTYKTYTAYTTSKNVKVKKPTGNWKFRVWSVNAYGKLSSSYAEGTEAPLPTVPTPTYAPVIAFYREPHKGAPLRMSITGRYDLSAYADDDINTIEFQMQHSPDSDFNNKDSTFSRLIDEDDWETDIGSGVYEYVAHFSKGIHRGHYYRARYRAIDKEGKKSAWSSPWVTSAASSFDPSTPQNPYIDVKQMLLTAFWDPPAGAGALDTYEYQVKFYRNGNAIVNSTQVVGGTTAAWQLQKPSTDYFTVRVWSKDNQGNLSASYAESAQTYLAVPPTPTVKPTFTFKNDPESRDYSMCTIAIYYDAASYTDEEISHYPIQIQHSVDANFNSGFNTRRRQIEYGDNDIDVRRITLSHYYRARFRAVDKLGKKSAWGSWTRAKRARIV